MSPYGLNGVSRYKKRKTTAGGYAELLSRETFSIPLRAMVGIQTGATHQANKHMLIELVSVDPATGLPDGRHSADIDVGGAAATGVTQAVYGIRNGGLRSQLSAAATITSTSTFSILELEPFHDETWWHSKPLDSATPRSNSYVRQQQIPDPTALCKLRVRSLNQAGWKSITGAVAGTGGAIRLTITAHGYSAGTLWVEQLNGVTNAGAEVRGNYGFTVIDVNTVELTGTAFAGTYVNGSGRAALAAAPAANVPNALQFVSVGD